MGRLGCGVVLFLGLVGCQQSGAPKPESRVMSEALTAQGTQDAPDKNFGEDCSENGSSACFSHLCMKFGTALAEGWQCTRQCDEQAVCPEGWVCNKVLPDPDGFVCVPGAEVSP